MRKLPQLSAALVALVLSACDRTEVSASAPTQGSNGNVSVSIDLGQVGVLARSLQMTPARLVLRFASGTSTLRDTIALSGSGTVLKSYSFARGAESLYVEGRDQRDSLLYSGSTTFQVFPAATTNVNVALNARYSSVRVGFPVIDSLYRFVLSVDGSVWADSSVAPGGRRGDTVKASHDYLSASASGTNHLFSLKAWGRYQGKDTVLYALDTALSIVSGSNIGQGLNLRWVGAGRPGQASLSVILGSVGHVELRVGYGNGTDTTRPADSSIALITDTAPLNNYLLPATDSASARALYGVGSFANISSSVTSIVPGGYVSLVAPKIASDGTEGYTANIGLIVPLTVDGASHDLTGLTTITFEYRNSDKITDVLSVQILSDVYNPAFVAAGTVYGADIFGSIALAPSTSWKTATIDVLDFATPTWWMSPADYPTIDSVLSRAKGLVIAPRTLYSASGQMGGSVCTKCVSPTMTKQVLDIRNITLHTMR